MYVTYKYKKLSNATLDLEIILSDIFKIITYSPTSPPNDVRLYNDLFTIDMNTQLSDICDKVYTLNTTTTIVPTDNPDINITTYANSYVKVLPEWELTSGLENTNTKIFVSSINNDPAYIKNLEIGLKSFPYNASDDKKVVGELVFRAYELDVATNFRNYTYGNNAVGAFLRPKIYTQGGYLHIFVENSHLFIASTNVNNILWTPGLGCTDFDPYLLRLDDEEHGSYQSSGNYPKWVFMSMNGFDNIACPRCFDIVKNEDVYTRLDAPATVSNTVATKLSKNAIDYSKRLPRLLGAAIIHEPTCTISTNLKFGVAKLQEILDVCNAFINSDNDSDKILPNGYLAKDLLEQLNYFEPKIAGTHINGPNIVQAMKHALMMIPFKPIPADPSVPKQNMFQIKSPYLVTMKNPASLNIPRYTINYNFKKAITCARVAIQNKFISNSRVNIQYKPLFFDIGGDVSTSTPIYMIGVNCKSLDKLDVILPEDDIIPEYENPSLLDDNDTNKKFLYDTEVGLFTVWDSMPSKGTRIKTGSRIKYIVRLG
jgi:hypothetical protein